MAECSSCTSASNASAYIQQAIREKTDPQEILRARLEAERQGRAGVELALGPTVNAQGQPLGTLINEAA